MKFLIGKIKRLLYYKKGETLMEAIVSVLLLSILLVTVTAMIQTSRNVTANSMQRAQEFQEELFNLTTFASDEDDFDHDLDDVDMEIEEGKITFVLPGNFAFNLPTGVYVIDHNIQVYDNNGIIVAFIPNP